MMNSKIVAVRTVDYPMEAGHREYQESDLVAIQ
jgi:hypothetical protein